MRALAEAGSQLRAWDDQLAALEFHSRWGYLTPLLSYPVRSHGHSHREQRGLEPDS